MIGILIATTKIERMKNGSEKKENISFYMKLAKQYKIDLMFYSPYSLVNFKARIEGYVFNHEKEQWKIENLPIPKINMIRTIIQDPSILLSMRKLEEEGVIFMNKTAGRNKDKMIHFLKETELRSYVPETLPLTFNNIVSSLEWYKAIMIKPVHGSMGERIVKIDKQKDHYEVQYIYRRQHHRKVVKNHSQLFMLCNRLFQNPKGYILQPWISFMKYEESPYDIRTSVQKDQDGEWRVTGIVARVAKKDGIVTNVAQGGRAVPFYKIEPFLSYDKKEELYKFSLDLARQIEIYNPYATDLGLDIGFDDAGKLWFIEANYCDERYAYRESGDLDMWQKSYEVPFSYAYAKFQSSADGKK